MSACRYIGNPIVLPICKIFTGFNVGIAGTVAPVYLNEIAPKQWKGAFGASFQIGAMFGSFFGTGGVYFKMF